MKSHNIYIHHIFFVVFSIKTFYALLLEWFETHLVEGSHFPCCTITEVLHVLSLTLKYKIEAIFLHKENGHFEIIDSIKAL